MDLLQLPYAGQKGGAEPALRVRLGREEPEVVLQILSHVGQTAFLSPDREDHGQHGDPDPGSNGSGPHFHIGPFPQLHRTFTG